MQNSPFLQSKICLLPTNLQMNYHGHFVITVPESQSESRRFIENNKDRNWNEKQILKFAAFLYYHHQKLCTVDARKAHKIFKLLSQYLQSRNVNQCRTFTIKMIKKFGNLAKLNQFFSHTLPQYQQAIERQKGRLQNIKNLLPDNQQPLLTDPQHSHQQSEKEIRLGDHYKQLRKTQQLKPTDTEYQNQQIHIQSSLPINQLHREIVPFFRSHQLASNRKIPNFEDSHILQNFSQEQNTMKGSMNGPLKHQSCQQHSCTLGNNVVKL